MCVRVCESLILGRDTVRDGEKGVYGGGGREDGWWLFIGLWGIRSIAGYWSATNREQGMRKIG